jgi:hypothetical protein
VNSHYVIRDSRQKFITDRVRVAATLHIRIRVLGSNFGRDIGYLTQPLTEMSITNLPEGKRQLVRQADNLTAICESIV